MENLVSWKHKNVFITGAAGLVGGWLTDWLLNEKANVTILQRDYDPNSLLVLDRDDLCVKKIQGNLEDYNLLNRVIQEHPFDVIFHLGAQTQVRVAVKNPWETFESNVRGTYNLLEACRHQESIKAIVVASSDKAYGTSIRLPYDEDTKLNGISIRK